MIQMVLAGVFVAVSGLGGYFAFRAFVNEGPTATGPNDEVAVVNDGAGSGSSSDESQPSDTDLVETDSGATPDLVPPPPVMLQVTSTPPGAAMSLDGQDTGQTTPAPIPLGEPYPQMIALSLDGYESVSEPVPQAEGDSVEMAFELIREETFGRVVLSGPYRFEVWIGDRRIREADSEHDVTLRTGTATLRIVNRGYSLDRRFTIEVAEGAREQLIAPALGSVTVLTNPGNCEIFLDAQTIGYQPISQRQVAPGTYAVSRRCPDEREDRGQPVTVVSNQDERVTFLPVPR